MPRQESNRDVIPPDSETPRAQLSSFAQADIEYHLHSQTNLAQHRSRGPLVIVRGDGAYVVDEAGRRYLECMSGLWCASLGFSNERLAAAAKRQIDALPYYHTFNHRSNDVVSKLAEAIVRVVPLKSARVFFANSGSEAIDSMVKFAWYFHTASGNPRKRKVLSREKAFHGSTVMGASLAGLPAMHASFGLPIEGIVRIDCPHFYRYGAIGESEAEYTDRLIDNLQTVIDREGADTIAAFIAEPIMGAGGVIVPPVGYFERVQQVLRQHDILLLSDEIVCGFGRTGTWFGCQSFGFEPDMMACAKGLSSGYLPISCVVMSGDIASVVEVRSGLDRGFGHGFTYSGHPVAAAVALEALNIYQELELPAVARRLGARLHERLDGMRSHPMVGEIRGTGLIAGIELVADKAARRPFVSDEEVGAQVEQAMRARGLIVRNMGDVIALCPPYIISDAQIDEMVAGLETALDEVHNRQIANG